MKICNLILIGLMFSLILAGGCTGGPSSNDQKYADNAKVAFDKYDNAVSCLRSNNYDCAKAEAVQARALFSAVTPDNKTLALAQSDLITSLNYNIDAIDHFKNNENSQGISDGNLAIEYLDKALAHLEGT